MKKIILSLILCVSWISNAQDFSAIQDKTNTYSGLLTADDLAEQISTDFSSDEDRVKAIFCWLTKNIRYDLEEFYNPTKTGFKFSYQTLEEKAQLLQEIKDNTVKETLSTKRAVCEGYAQTFSKLCDILSIENDVIGGYTRTSYHDINNPIQTPNHAWNAVKLKGKWLYIDATWSAGYENNGKWIRRFNPYYYNIPKQQYFKTHLPEKSIWKLRVGRMEKDAFYKQPIYSHHFLKSNIELLSPKAGVLYKDRNGSINITLKNAKNKQIHLGFLGMPYAQQPKVVTLDNGKTEVSITPPRNSKQAFLLIDKQVFIEFLVK